MGYEGKQGKQKSMSCPLDHPDRAFSDTFGDSEPYTEENVVKALAMVAICGNCPNSRIGYCKKQHTDKLKQLVRYINAHS